MKAKPKQKNAAPALRSGRRVGRTLPPSRVEEQSTHFTIKYAVYSGRKSGEGCSIAYFDDKTRADLVVKALNSFRLTAAGKRWWKRQCA